MLKNKVLPGEPGHLEYAKKNEMFKVIITLVIILIIFFTGFVIMGNRKSIFTLFAVLGCLPLARYAVNWIVRLPYHSFNKSEADRLLNIVGSMPLVFDFVFTNKEKNHAVDALAISDNTICGYTSNNKTDPAKAEAYLTKNLHDQGYRKVTVKIFTDPAAFEDRLYEMAEHYSCDSDKQSSKEERICSTLFAISL